MKFTTGPKFPKTKVGEIFNHNGKMYRRGLGIYYAAKPADPFVERNFRARLKKQGRKGPGQPKPDKRRKWSTKDIRLAKMS